MNEDYPASPQISKTTTLVTGFLTAEYPATCLRLLEAEGSAFGDSPIARETFEKLVIGINALEAQMNRYKAGTLHSAQVPFVCQHAWP